MRAIDADELRDRVVHFGGRGKKKIIEMIDSQDTIDGFMPVDEVYRILKREEAELERRQHETD